VDSSFETPAFGGLLRMRSETLVVRSAAAPRVSNHEAPMSGREILERNCDALTRLRLK
jgi:hypothetical protein